MIVCLFSQLEEVRRKECKYEFNKCCKICTNSKFKNFAILGKDDGYVFKNSDLSILVPIVNELE